jgi:hypothetical protein
MHLVGFTCYNFITMDGINIVKNTKCYFRLFTYQMAYMNIILWRLERLFVIFRCDIPVVLIHRNIR